MADLENEVLDWDSEVEDDGSGDFVLLDPGEYPFEVYKLERKFYNGSEKIPPCPMAELTLRVSGPNGLTAMVTDRVYLVKKSEWKISELMRCLGQKQHGEKCKPNWAKVQGARGMVRLGQHEYTGRDGKPRTSNDVARYLDPVDTTPTYGGTGKKPWQK